MVSIRRYNRFKENSDNANLVFDMNIYYINLKSVTQSTGQVPSPFPPEKIPGCKDNLIGDMVDLLNDALSCLNGVYTDNAFPIK